MKILIMVLIVALTGCTSTAMKDVRSFYVGSIQGKGLAVLIKKGYTLHGVRTCYYSLGSERVEIPSDRLDKWKHGRCPATVSINQRYTKVQ